MPLLSRLLPLILPLVLFLMAGGIGHASESPPPSPVKYVTDETGVIPAALLERLNAELEAFEKQTSTQIVAVVAGKLPDRTTLSDYAQTLFHAWGIGTKEHSNGVLMLVFTGDRKVRIQPGYGLEGALPDALCARIIREKMLPAFRSGNYGEGLSGGISAVMQASRGEYKGTGHQPGKRTPFKDFLFSPIGLFLMVFLILLLVGRNGRNGGGGGGLTPGSAAAAGLVIGGLGGFAGRGQGGGEGASGGFSGGGGDSGGGGAEGGW